MLGCGKAFRFTARGYSMGRFVQDGDIITVAPFGMPPKTGMIVAFIRPKNHALTVHRILSITPEGYLIKGDNLSEPDGVIGGESLLGRVIRIERLGKSVSIFTPVGRVIALLSRLNLLFRFRQLCNLPKGIARALLRRLQSTAVYPKLIHGCSPELTIRVADQTEMFEVRRQLLPGVWKAPFRPDTRVTRYVAKSGQTPVGFIELIRNQPEQVTDAVYRLHSLYVRTRSRRMGIGKRLTYCVISLAKEEGAAELKLAVRERNQVAIGLFAKFGFVRSSGPIPERSLTPDMLDWTIMSINFTSNTSEKTQQIDEAI